MAATSTNVRKQVLLVSAGIGVVGLIAASDAWHDRARELIAACEVIIANFPTLGMAVFVGLAMASAMLAFFSSAILVPVGIYAWGTTICFLLLWLGWFLGGVAAFAIGRYLGHTVVELAVGQDRLRHLKTRISRRARFIHILLFQAMMPSEIPGYVLGSLHYRFLPFAAALALAELPYAIGTIFIGENFLAGRVWVLVATAASGLLIAVIAYSLYGRARRVGARSSAGNL